MTDRKWGGCHFCFSLQLKCAPPPIFEMFQIKATDLSLIFYGLVLILFFFICVDCILLASYKATVAIRWIISKKQGH